MNANSLMASTRERLRKHEGNYAEIARRNRNLSYSSLTKFAQGQLANPTVQSLQHVIDALDRFEASAAPEDLETDPDTARIEPLESLP